MGKGQDLFLDHFARLGVFSKVSALAGSIEDLEEEGAMAEDTKEPKQVRVYFLLNILKSYKSISPTT